jgi:hypothetical protein
MNEVIQRARWAALQELNDDDIMDSIQGSVAIPLAIKQGDWNDALELLKRRIETKITRLAELSFHGMVHTPWIDDDEELRELRNLWVLREASRLAIEKERIEIERDRKAKMDAQFQQMFDE